MTHPAVKYLKQFAPLASQLSVQYGVPVEAILTQGAVESGWGRTTPGNNYFGIKSGGKYKRYAAPADSFLDYAATMSRDPRYAPALEARTPEEFLQVVAQRGYSTRDWRVYYKFAHQILTSVRKYSAMAGVSHIVESA
jgi:flagellum-specific peptidoglycan hydrolase FlgJ